MSIIKAAFCVLAFGAIPALGQIAPVAVYTNFQNQPSETVLSALQREVESLLSRIGIGVTWKSINAIRADDVSVELAVATFRGVCDEAPLPRDRGRSGRLGWTHVSDGVVLPFAEMNCDDVRGFVRTQLDTFSRPERDRIYGRTLGRVLAHELYHVLGRTTHHSTRGVDQPSYTARELVSNQFVLEESPYRILSRSAAAAHPAVPAESYGSGKKGSAIFQQQGCGVCHGVHAEGTRNGPVLRIAGCYFNPVLLAAKLGIDAEAMLRKAKHLKVPSPSVKEEDLDDLVSFLNSTN